MELRDSIPLNYMNLKESRSYFEILLTQDTAVNTAEVRETKKQLKRHIKNAESTLRDVQTTVQLVENDRDKFNHIDDKELYERKSLVQTSGDRLSRAKQESHDRASEGFLGRVPDGLCTTVCKKAQRSF